MVWWFGDWVVGFATLPIMHVQIDSLLKTVNIWLDWLFSYMNFPSSPIQATGCPKFATWPFLWPFFSSSFWSKTENHLNLQPPGFSTWKSDYQGCLDVTGAPLVAEAPLPPELQKVLAALVELEDHWRSTSWRILCNASNGKLRPAISKLQMIMVPQERLVWTYVSFLSFVHIRATKAPGHLKNTCRLWSLILPKPRNPRIPKTSRWGNLGKVSP